MTSNNRYRRVARAVSGALGRQPDDGSGPGFTTWFGGSVKMIAWTDDAFHVVVTGGPMFLADRDRLTRRTRDALARVRRNAEVRAELAAAVAVLARAADAALEE